VHSRLFAFVERRKDFIQLLGDANESCSSAQLLQLRRTDVRTRWPDPTENIQHCVFHWTTILNFHRLPFGSPAVSTYIFNHYSHGINRTWSVSQTNTHYSHQTREYLAQFCSVTKHRLGMKNNYVLLTANNRINTHTYSNRNISITSNHTIDSEVQTGII